MCGFNMKKIEKVNIGIIGCGYISEAYLQIGKNFEILNFIACADVDLSKAKERGDQFNIPYTDVKSILENPEIEVIINLTPPQIHAEIGMAILKAGKSLYSEKPLTIDKKSAKKLLVLAKKKNLYIGCAPDTFLGGGIQTCRNIIDQGLIGKPVAAAATMISHGHESWHPNPEFYYKTGAGPMFDMGPYYITALISLLGPVKRVTASNKISFTERTITSEPKKGSKIKVEVPTHINAILDFNDGTIATLITTFDVWSAHLPMIEIYGTDGTLSVPDPNTFGGPILLRTKDSEKWVEVPFTHGYTENSRSIGLAEMCYSIRKNRLHRANGDMGYHVVDVMQSIHESSDKNKHIFIASTCKQPKALPSGKDESILK